MDAEVMAVISRLPGCAGQAAYAVPAYTQGQIGRCTITVKKNRSHNIQIFGYDTYGLNHDPVWKIQSFLLSEICTAILWQDYNGNSNSRKFY